MTKTKSQKRRAAQGGNRQALVRALKGKPGKMHGKGGFFADRWKDLKDVIGEVIHPGDLADLGGRIGRGGGTLISKAIGAGDYTIRRNSIVESMPVGADGELDKRFSFAQNGAASIRIKKREYLGQVLAGDDPGSFQQIQYRLQATDSATFPWMHRIGVLFTEWRLVGGILSFETTSSNYSSQVGLGTIAMATQYNANMLPYADMDSVLQSAYHTRGNPSENLIHGIECDPKLQSADRLFTRRPGAAGPPNLYDHGVVTVATQGLDSGMAPGTSLGRVYFTYDVECSLPELPIQAPYQHAIGCMNWLANSATTPPCGNALNMVVDAASEMTIAVSSGSNVLLLAPATGPLVQPTQAPQDEAELCAWINDDSGNATKQFWSFARAGHYILTIRRLDTVGGAFAAGDTTLTTLKDTVVTPIFTQQLAVDTATWVFHIDVRVASGNVVLENTRAGVDAGKFILTLGQ